MLTILIIILILAAVGGLPSWPYMAGRGYGYYPSGLLGIVLVIILIWLLVGGGRL